MLEPDVGEESSYLSPKVRLMLMGVDISSEAKTFGHDFEVSICDIETEKLPFKDDTFDIYSKSFIEHLYYPERYLKEAYRVLNQGDTSNFGT